MLRSCSGYMIKRILYFVLVCDARETGKKQWYSPKVTLEDVSFEINGTIRLECQVNAFPPAENVIWKKDGVIFGNSNNVTTIIILNATRNHVGTYECIAENAVGNGSATADVYLAEPEAEKPVNRALVLFVGLLGPIGIALFMIGFYSYRKLRGHKALQGVLSQRDPQGKGDRSKSTRSRKSSRNSVKPGTLRKSVDKKTDSENKTDTENKTVVEDLTDKSAKKDDNEQPETEKNTDRNSTVRRKSKSKRSRKRKSKDDSKNLSQSIVKSARGHKSDEKITDGNKAADEDNTDGGTKRNSNEKTDSEKKENRSSTIRSKKKSKKSPEKHVNE